MNWGFCSSLGQRGGLIIGNVNIYSQPNLTSKEVLRNQSPYSANQNVMQIFLRADILSSAGSRHDKGLSGCFLLRLVGGSWNILKGTTVNPSTNREYIVPSCLSSGILTEEKWKQEEKRSPVELAVEQGHSQDFSQVGHEKS